MTKKCYLQINVKTMEKRSLKKFLLRESDVLKTSIFQVQKTLFPGQFLGSSASQRYEILRFLVATEISEAWER